MAISKDCPVWMKEKSIQRVKTENRISYPEARKLVEGLTPSPLTKSYAAVAKPATRTIDCQTDLTWLSGEKPKSRSPDKCPTVPPLIKIKKTEMKSASVQTGAPLPPSSSKKNQEKQGKTTNKERVKMLSGRVPKGAATPISIKNAYSALQDIEMAEVPPSRGRSVSPKLKLVERVPITPQT
jgi:hypothetical protein